MVVVRKRGQICGGVYANAQVPNPKAFSGGVVPVFNPILFPNGPPRVPMPMPSIPKDLIKIQGMGYYDPTTGVWSTSKKQFSKYLMKHRNMSETEADQESSNLTEAQAKQRYGKLPKKKMSPTAFFKMPVLKEETKESETVPESTKVIPSSPSLPEKAKKIVKEYLKESRKPTSEQTRKEIRRAKKTLGPVIEEAAKKIGKQAKVVIARKRLANNPMKTIRQVGKANEQQMSEMIAPIMHMADKEERKKIIGTKKDTEDMINALASQNVNIAPSRKERAATTKRPASQRSKSKKGTEGITEKLASKEKTMIRKKPALAKIPKEKIMKKRVVRKPKSVAQKKPKLAKICSEKIKVLV